MEDESRKLGREDILKKAIQLAERNEEVSIKAAVKDSTQEKESYLHILISNIHREL